MKPWASECPNVKNYKRRLNPIWHGMLYSCTRMATVGIKLLTAQWEACIARPVAYAAARRRYVGYKEIWRTKWLATDRQNSHKFYLFQSWIFLVKFEMPYFHHLYDIWKRIFTLNSRWIFYMRSNSLKLLLLQNTFVSRHWEPIDRHAFNSWLLRYHFRTIGYNNSVRLIVRLSHSSIALYIS